MLPFQARADQPRTQAVREMAVAGEWPDECCLMVLRSYTAGEP